MKKRILALLLTVLMVTALLPFGASAAGEKLIALTFDDGPSQYTSQLLDGLAARGAKVTFFMLGQMAEGRSSLVKRAWEEGHQICSHTYSHPNLNTLSAAEIRSQLSRTDSILDNALGFDARYMMRPPYGNANATVRSTVNVPAFYWSVDTRDWESRNATSAYNEFLRAARDGSIVLMHDVYPTTITAALNAIDTLQSQGYEFVTVAELFYRRGETLQNMNTSSKSDPLYYYCYPNSNGTASALATPSIKQTADPNGALSITITGDSRGSIYYTTNGAVPNPANSKRYTGPFTVGGSCTVKAVTVVDWNSVRSRVASVKVDYMPAAAPVIDIQDGVMTMTSATAGAVIRYTTDGSAPTKDSAVYSAPVAIEKGTTVKAYAIASGYNASATMQLTYTANGNLMQDVAVSDWYYEALDRAVTMGIINGTAPQVMSPNIPLTRAMLVTMLHRLAKPEEAGAAVSFPDVKTGEYYYAPLCWAVDQKIVNGYPDGTFQPNKSITRAELCVMIARYLRSIGHELSTDLSVLDQFKDARSIADWAKQDVAAMVALGVIKGYETGTVGAERGATRAEAVTMLLRAADIPAPQPEDPDPVDPDPVDPEPAETSKALAEVLNAIMSVQPGASGSEIRKAEAAALLLNFLRTDDAKDESLAEQMKTWYDALSEGEQEAVQAAIGDVISLSHRIIIGDVTAEQVAEMLADTEVKLEPIPAENDLSDLLLQFSIDFDGVDQP